MYHGSKERVAVPEVRLSDRTLDYGNGFYATTSYIQAEKWVRRKMAISSGSMGYVNEYNLDIVAITSLRCLFFKEPSEEWLDFVMSNRMDKHFVHDYDIVYGPVANDRVYAAFALFEGGVLDRQGLIAQLRTYKLVDQYLFHTSEALKALTFIGAKEVRV